MFGLSGIRVRERPRGRRGPLTALTVLLIAAGALIPTAALAGTLSGPPSVSFGNVAVGSPSSRIVLVTNSGTATAITSSAVSGGDFSHDAGCDGIVLGPGQLCSIAVGFLPQGPGLQEGTLTVNSDSAAGALELHLSGTGVTPDFEISPAPFSFQPVLSGAESAPQAFDVANAGSAAGTIAEVALQGSGATHFRVVSDSCSSTPIAAGGSCSLGLVFAPTAPGTWAAELAVNSDALDSPDLAAVDGVAEASTHGKPPHPPGRVRCKKPKGTKKPPELPRRCRPHKH